jgi:transcriptional antiterminator RfaH
LRQASDRDRIFFCSLRFAWENLNAIMSDLPWFVVHTRPRCEKKLAQYCQREGLAFTLPCYRSVKKYRGKQVTFEKPLFPGYLFLRLSPPQKRIVYQSDYVANVLEVIDQPQFEQQLGDILLALETDLEIRLAPQIAAGSRVRIKYGPLRGVEGWVEQRSGSCEVILRLDFIGQAAAVKIEATELELI